MTCPTPGQRPPNGAPNARPTLRQRPPNGGATYTPHTPMRWAPLLRGPSPQIFASEKAGRVSRVDRFTLGFHNQPSLRGK